MTFSKDSREDALRTHLAAGRSGRSVRSELNTQVLCSGTRPLMEYKQVLNPCGFLISNVFMAAPFTLDLLKTIQAPT